MAGKRGEAEAFARTVGLLCDGIRAVEKVEGLPADWPAVRLVEGTWANGLTVRDGAAGHVGSMAQRARLLSMKYHAASLWAADAVETSDRSVAIEADRQPKQRTAPQAAEEGNQLGAVNERACAPRNESTL